MEINEILKQIKEVGDSSFSVPMIPPEMCTLPQMMLELAFYGYILYTAADLIGNGSELLLLVPSMAAITGSIIIPCLGAVPDVALNVFSIVNGKEEPPAILGLAIGNMAGSVVYMYSIAWFFAYYLGRVDLIPDKDNPGRLVPNYGGKPKLSENNKDLSKSGVGLAPDTGFNTILSVITSFNFLLIQLPNGVCSKEGLGDGGDGATKPEAGASGGGKSSGVVTSGMWDSSSSSLLQTNSTTPWDPMEEIFSSFLQMTPHMSQNQFVGVDVGQFNSEGDLIGFRPDDDSENTMLKKSPMITILVAVLSNGGFLLYLLLSLYPNLKDRLMFKKQEAIQSGKLSLRGAMAGTITRESFGSQRGGSAASAFGLNSQSGFGGPSPSQFGGQAPGSSPPPMHRIQEIFAEDNGRAGQEEPLEDADGNLTARGVEEYNTMKQTIRPFFMEADRDKDGFITRTEFSKFLRDGHRLF